jgi:hypothetical protein
MSLFKRLLLAFLIVVTAVAAITYSRYGGGVPYPDVSTPARLDAQQLELVLTYPEPLANVAVAQDGRVFFTIHPESRPTGNKLLVKDLDGNIRPYPSQADQAGLFDAVMGVVINAGNILYTIDHGQHASKSPRIIGFDLSTNQKVLDHVFSAESAPLGAMLQDLQVDSKGEFAYLADVGFLNQRPGLVVLNLKTLESWRVLDKHPSVTAQNWLIRTPIKPMRFLGGLIVLKPGVDGIAISKDDQTLVYGAMAHDTLFAVPTSKLKENKGAQAEAFVKALGRKPLNDGLSMDKEGNVFITDVEHGSVMKMSPEGVLNTVIRDEKKIRWADALSFGPEGYLYVADSSIPDQMLQTKAHMAAQAPYAIFRFKPGTQGVAGQ